MANGNQQALVGVKLNDLSGLVSDFSKAAIAGIVITSALAGTLTIAGVSQANGSPQSWVIASTTVGWVAAPGSGLAWNPTTFTFSNAADKGNAYALLTPA
jgi:hypothetical protein